MYTELRDADRTRYTEREPTLSVSQRQGVHVIFFFGRFFQIFFLLYYLTYFYKYLILEKNLH